jgi:hypothetical protein
MQFETSYVYNQKLVQKASWCVVKRYLAWHIGLLCCGVLGFYLLISGKNVGFGGFLIGISACYLYGLWDSLGRSVSIPANLKGQELKISLSDDHMRFESAIRTTTLKWNGIPLLWKYKELWLLFFDRSLGHYTAIPASALSDAAKEFIEQKVRENKGRVS